MLKNFYSIFGMPSDSSQDDIKAACRRLAKEFYADHFGGNHSPFLVIQEAYSMFSDPPRRWIYYRILPGSRNFGKQQTRTGIHQFFLPPLFSAPSNTRWQFARS